MVVFLDIDFLNMEFCTQKKLMEKGKKILCIDESVNRYGFRVLMSGADLTQFKRNPVMLFDHREWGLPIGRWDNITIEGDKLFATPVFDLKDEDAKRIEQKIDDNFIRILNWRKKLITMQKIRQGQRIKITYNTYNQGITK
jgi:hypothetical protein